MSDLPLSQCLPEAFSLTDRILGGMVGLLIGDACGVPVEFSSREERNRDPVRDFRGFGTHAQPIGHWSDDGSLALAHVAAFLESEGWKPEAHMREFSAWFEKGRHSASGHVFDVGESTSRAILRHLSGSPWFACGCRGVFDNGNGSLMRILPVSLWAWQESPAERERIISEASALTHAHRRSELTCVVYAELCASMLEGSSLRSALYSALDHTQPLRQEKEWAELTAVICDDLFQKPKQDIRSTGYVISCLEAALWCLDRHDTFTECILEAVNLGGDTDTTAAVCGGLAGIRCGFSGLPGSWRDALPRQAYLRDLIQDFAMLIQQNLHKGNTP